jgi:glucoamylase
LARRSKDGFGTSTSLQSKVWFTLTKGVLSEVYYPTLDKPNTQSLRFIICTGQICKDEAEDMEHSVRVPNRRSLTFQQINTTVLGAQASSPADSQTLDRLGQQPGEDACAPRAKHQLCITKTYTTDVERATVLIDVRFESPDDPNSVVYVY